MIQGEDEEEKIWIKINQLSASSSDKKEIFQLFQVGGPPEISLYRSTLIQLRIPDQHHLITILTVPILGIRFFCGC